MTHSQLRDRAFLRHWHVHRIVVGCRPWETPSRFAFMVTAPDTDARYDELDDHQPQDTWREAVLDALHCIGRA